MISFPFSRHEHVAEGIAVSASNLPVECRQFGGDMIWARMYDEMLQGQRQRPSRKVSKPGSYGLIT